MLLPSAEDDPRAILPAHVLIHAASHGLQLIGWGHSVEAGRRITTISTRFRDWYPPEVLRRQDVGPATDLFLAARCVVYLFGGDPLANKMPDSVPAAMQRFFNACLLEGPRMRPEDAWTLQEEFDALVHPRSDIVLGFILFPRFGLDILQVELVSRRRM